MLFEDACAVTKPGLLGSKTFQLFSVKKAHGCKAVFYLLAVSASAAIDSSADRAGDAGHALHSRKSEFVQLEDKFQQIVPCPDSDQVSPPLKFLDLVLDNHSRITFILNH